MDWNQVFPTLNGIVGGVIMALVAWLVSTGKLHLGRETLLYKNLWEGEKTKREKQEELNDKLAHTLQANNQTLVTTTQQLASRVEELSVTNRKLQDDYAMLRALIGSREGQKPT